MRLLQSEDRGHRNSLRIAWEVAACGGVAVTRRRLVPARAIAPHRTFGVTTKALSHSGKMLPDQWAGLSVRGIAFFRMPTFKGNAGLIHRRTTAAQRTP